MTAPLPLPATPEAHAMGCPCAHVLLDGWDCQGVKIHPDCPLHSESARAARDDEWAQPARLSGGAT